jgi:predicted MFS family arabinose efflux permease
MAGAESEQTMSLKALVIGGTGAVGKYLVGELLNSKVKDFMKDIQRD